MGQKDSNLRITEPKPAALPLGHAPDFISIMVFFRAKVNGCPKREQPKKVSFTNLIYVLLEGDIGVPFRVIHDVKDQNHDRSLFGRPVFAQRLCKRTGELLRGKPWNWR